MRMPPKNPKPNWPAEIPDWLSAPAEEAEAAWDENAAEETEAELAADIPDWLAAPADEAKTVWDEDAAEETEAELAAEIPDWLSAPADETKTAWDEDAAEETEAEMASEIPDWLSAPADEAITAWDETPTEETEAEMAADIPDWLSHLDEPEPTMEDTRPSKTSLAMAQKETDIENIDQLSQLFDADQSETPEPEMESLTAKLDTVLQTDEADELEVPDEDDQAFAWLEGLAARQGADQETLFSDEAQTQEAPDWILEAASESKPISDVELEYLEPETPKRSQTELEWQAEEFEEPLPTAESAALTAEIEDVVEPGQVEAAISELEEMDDAFAWLESLAAKQGADEALLLKPEERQSEAPEWVRLESLEQAAEPEAIQETSQESEEISEQMLISAELETDTEPPIQELDTQETVIAWSPAEPEPATLLSEPDEISLIEQVSEPSEIETTGEAAVMEESPEEEAVAAEIWGDEEVTEDLFKPEEIISEKADETKFTKEISGPEAVELEAPELAHLEEESPDSEEIPELPAWLADAEPTPEDEVLEWTPPSRMLKPVELNQASLVELERLPGVGFRLAQEIIAFRDQHGHFNSLEKLAEVPGADDLNLEALAPFLILPEPVEAIVEEAVSTPALTFAQAADVPELEPARQALLQGDLEAGVQIYNQLIESQHALPDVIQDLGEAVKVHPDSFELWQSLGDAYQRSYQVREALAAYLKAQELLG